MQPSAHLESSFKRLHALAQARELPGVHHGGVADTPALAVDDSPFIELVDAATALLHCPVDQKVLLMEISPDLYFETEDQVGSDLMLIRLDRIDDEELSLRLHDAWMFRAPEMLKKA